MAGKFWRFACSQITICFNLFPRWHQRLVQEQRSLLAQGRCMGVESKKKCIPRGTSYSLARTFCIARCTIGPTEKRRLASACRPSACSSVTLVDQDHIGWKSRKLIARTISQTPSLFVAQRPSTYSQGKLGNIGKFWTGRFC